MATKFNKDQLVSFSRNTMVNSGATNIKAVVPFMDSPMISKDLSPSQIYIIEHTTGWYPNYQRQQKFGLDPTKKYIFVSEDELS